MPVDAGSAFVPGHEFAGRIVADDSGRFEPGELVAVDPAKPCLHCEWCRRAQHNLCPNVEFTGAPPFDGALTRTIVAAERQIFRMPAGLNVRLFFFPLQTNVYTVTSPTSGSTPAARYFAAA